MKPLKELRIRKFLSVRELARTAGVAQRTIVEAEAGRRAMQPATMRKIAAALEIDPMDVAEFRRAVEAKSAA